MFCAHCSPVLSGTCSRRPALEVETEAHSGEPLTPGRTARWGKELGFTHRPVELQSPHTGPGRKAKDSRRRARLAGLPQTREQGFGDGSCWPGRPLSYCSLTPLGVLSSGLQWSLPGSGFAISAGPREASGSQTGLSSPVSPGQSTG